jgi:type III restriction enzyme
MGLEKYVKRMVERLRDSIVPDESEGEPPLMPILNRYKPIGTTTDVDFKTTRPCHATAKSHIDQVVLDNLSWEASASFRLESSDAVAFYARNDHISASLSRTSTWRHRPLVRTGLPGAAGERCHGHRGDQGLRG